MKQLKQNHGRIVSLTGTLSLSTPYIKQEKGNKELNVKITIPKCDLELLLLDVFYILTQIAQ